MWSQLVVANSVTNQRFLSDKNIFYVTKENDEDKRKAGYTYEHMTKCTLVFTEAS